MGDYGLSYRRALVFGVFAGVLIVAVVVAGYLVWGREAGRPGTPSSVLVVALTEEADGAVVAAAIVRFDSVLSTAPENLDVYDPQEQVEIAGTTYDRLQDVYAFGGGEAVANAVADVTGHNTDAWVVLPAETWQRIVDGAGGARISVPTAVNAFVDDELHVILPGNQSMRGEDIVALHASLPYFPDDADSLAVRKEIGMGLAGAIVKRWSSVARAVEEGAVESSASSRDIESFAEEGSGTK